MRVTFSLDNLFFIMKGPQIKNKKKSLKQFKSSIYSLAPRTSCMFKIRVWCLFWKLTHLVQETTKGSASVEIEYSQNG